MGKYLIWAMSVFLASPFCWAKTPETQPALKLSIPPFSAVYHARKLGMRIGVLRTQLYRLENGQYVYEAHSKSTGLLSVFRKERVHEKSVWHYKDGKILPISFLYNQTGRKQRHITANFDWNNMTYTKNNKGQISTNPLPAGTLDHHLYQIALMLDGKKQAKSMEYSILDRRKIQQYQFKLEGSEELKTKVGKVTTLKYRRQRQNSRRQTILWIAQNLHYLPVKITHIEKNGSKFYMEIQSVTGLSTSQN